MLFVPTSDQLVCETVIMVLGIQKVYETKLRSPKKKKKKRKWSPLTFGPISPKSKHEKSDLQKKSTPLTRARIFCGVYNVFENRKRYTT